MSGQVHGAELELGNVTGERADGGVAHGEKLLAFTEAVMAGAPEAIAETRSALRAVLDDEAFVDTVAVIGSFNVVDRIADATGIPLDAGLRAMTGDLPAELGLVHFASAANTPGATGSVS